MCLFSMENETRLMRVGDSARVDTVRNYHGGFVTAMVPKTPESGITCLCVKEGFVLRLTNIPTAIVEKHGLVSRAATVIFREGAEDSTKARDRFEFDNGEVVNLSNLLKGVEVTCLEAGVEPEPSTASEEVQINTVEPFHSAIPAGALPESEFAHVSVRLSNTAVSYRNRVLAGLGAFVFLLAINAGYIS